MSCLWTYVSILYCCNCWYNYECTFVIAPWGTLIGIKYIVLYCIVLFRLFIVVFYIFVFILIENFPLKNIARLYEARLYFVVDKEKCLLEKLVELVQVYVEIGIFYPKSSLLSSFSSTENEHFCYMDLARKLWVNNIVPKVLYFVIFYVKLQLGMFVDLKKYVLAFNHFWKDFFVF